LPRSSDDEAGGLAAAALVAGDVVGGGGLSEQQRVPGQRGGAGARAAAKDLLRAPNVGRFAQADGALGVDFNGVTGLKVGLEATIQLGGGDAGLSGQMLSRNLLIARVKERERVTRR